jgi:hypothetical protein
MTRESDGWWWKFQIQRNAKIAKLEIVAHIKKSQLCMGIEFDTK